MDSSTLESFRVATPVGTVYYIPNFVDDDRAQSTLERIYGAPRTRWKELSRRRLQNWGGLPHPKGMVPEPLPAWLTDLGARIEQLGVFSAAAFKAPNHCLINEYRVGQGIMPHEDGPTYFPTVATLSLGDHTVLELYAPIDAEPGSDPISEREDGRKRVPQFRLLLEKNSLLLLTGKLYTEYMHGIDERDNDVIDETYANVPSSLHGTVLQRTETRVSLTFRVVERVLKAKILLR